MIAFSDVEGIAPWIYDRLQQIHGSERVTTDLSRNDLTATLIIIGPNWLPAIRHSSKYHTSQRDDLSQALVRGDYLIPVLVNGGRIPDSNKLPKSLRRLARIPPLYLEQNLVEPLNHFRSTLGGIKAVIEQLSPDCVRASDRARLLQAVDFIVSEANVIGKSLSEDRINRLFNVIVGRTDHLRSARQRSQTIQQALRDVERTLRPIAADRQCVSDADRRVLITWLLPQAFHSLERVDRRLCFPSRPKAPPKPVPVVQARRQRTSMNFTMWAQIFLLALVALLLTILLLFSILDSLVRIVPPTPTPMPTPTQVDTPIPTETPRYSIGQELVVIDNNGAWMREEPSSGSDVIITVVPAGVCVRVVNPQQVLEQENSQYWVNASLLTGDQAGWIEERSLALCIPTATPGGPPAAPDHPCVMAPPRNEENETSAAMGGAAPPCD